MTASSPNIYQRMNAIAADAEVAKGGKAPGAVGGFAFHKIDDVEAVLKPLFIKHGVTAIPTVAESSFELNGGWNWATVRVDISFVNVENPEDVVVVSSVGQGNDKQDKATGKAISYACKNAYLSIFHLKGQSDPETDSTAEHVPSPVAGRHPVYEEDIDPTQVVPDGKNRGKSYSKLTDKQLAWYAENHADDTVRKAAAEELEFRSEVNQDKGESEELF